jgi:hypothetical protein
MTAIDRNRENCIARNCDTCIVGMTGIDRNRENCIAQNCDTRIVGMTGTDRNRENCIAQNCDTHIAPLNVGIAILAARTGVSREKFPRQKKTPGAENELRLFAALGLKDVTQKVGLN